jgi:sulfite reductase (NADPH) hemoprotein beta-component
MGVQRDYGDRADRSRARFKYTVDDKGLDWIKAAIEDRLGFALGEARAYAFTTNGDTLGWQRGEDGREHYTLRIENGRVKNFENLALFDGIRAIAEAHRGTFRVTPNQNLIIAEVDRADRPKIDTLLKAHGLDRLNGGSGLRRNSMACVALPTCGLAMAESERYLPSLIDKLEPLLAKHGLADTPITLRMTGCPNGCARPYIAEIALTGRAPGKYNLYVGGGFHGERLNEMLRENIGEAEILATLDGLFARYAAERLEGEHFGDYIVRVRDTLDGVRAIAS